MLRQDIDPDEELETVYVYVYDDDPEPRPRFRWRVPHLDKERFLHALVQVLAILLFAGFCCVPGQPIYQVHTLSLPAILLPLQVRQATVTIVPTGIQVIPAKQAHGTLTLYNGASIAESLRAGFLLTASNGIELVTDSAVTVPAEDTSVTPPTQGMATVSAHAAAGGVVGNIPAYSVNAVVGSSLYIKNLTAFTGGQDARQETYATSADIQKATASAKEQVAAQEGVAGGYLQTPCTESVTQTKQVVTVFSRCQYVTYTAPKGVQVLSARVDGSRIIVQVKSIVLPQ